MNLLHFDEHSKTPVFKKYKLINNIKNINNPPDW